MSRITMQDVAVMSVQYVQHSFDYYLDSMERCGLRRVDLWGRSAALLPTRLLLRGRGRQPR